MNTEKISPNRFKSPKFKHQHDEEYDWEDQVEEQKRRKKMNKKSQRRTTIREKW